MTHLFHASVMKQRQKPPMGGEADDGPHGSDNGVAESAHAILAEAESTLSNASLSEAERVHALRRAFKRWRALLRLLAGPVGEAAETRRAEARELMRTLATARDQQSALDALDDLTKGDSPLSPASLKSLRERLTAMRNAAESAAMTPELHARIGEYLAKAASELEAWHLPQIPFDMVADAITATYRRARARVPEQWEQADADRLHELRRRVVEHRHQMELIEPLWPRFSRMWGAETQRLRNQLGACQDLAVLAGLLAPHQPLARWRSRLAPAIEARRTAHLRNAARLAGRLFADKPQAFRGRIGALWEAREAADEAG